VKEAAVKLRSVQAKQPEAFITGVLQRELENHIEARVSEGAAPDYVTVLAPTHPHDVYDHGLTAKRLGSLRFFHELANLLAVLAEKPGLWTMWRCGPGLGNLLSSVGSTPGLESNRSVGTR
jgi:hypothetical protein